MMKDISSFIRLKYEIITSNSDTWHLCEAYPAEVRSKWAWRCAGDVEHLAKGFPSAEKCIEVAKRYRDGLATKEELANAADSASSALVAYAASAAGLAGANAANAAIHAAAGAAAFAVAAGAATYAPGADATTYGVKWKLYIKWLVEELCEWENKQ